MSKDKGALAVVLRIKTDADGNCSNDCPAIFDIKLPVGNIVLRPCPFLFDRTACLAAEIVVDAEAEGYASYTLKRFMECSHKWDRYQRVARAYQVITAKLKG